MLDRWFTRPGSRSLHALDTLAQRLHAAGWSADALTYAAVISGCGGALCFVAGHDGLGLIAVIASALLDAVDGRVARLAGRSTLWGGVLDLTFDRIVEASVMLGIAVPRPALHLPCLVLAATWYVNLCVFLAVGAASERHTEKIIHYPPGLLERGEALFFLTLMLLLPRLAPAIAYLYAGLEVLTAWQRFRHGRKALRRLA